MSRKVSVLCIVFPARSISGM